jgi:hypothetical protein
MVGSYHGTAALPVVVLRCGDGRVVATIRTRTIGVDTVVVSKMVVVRTTIDGGTTSGLVGCETTDLYDNTLPTIPCRILTLLEGCRPTFEYIPICRFDAIYRIATHSKTITATTFPKYHN